MRRRYLQLSGQFGDLRSVYPVIVTVFVPSPFNTGNKRSNLLVLFLLRPILLVTWCEWLWRFISK